MLFTAFQFSFLIDDLTYYSAYFPQTKMAKHNDRAKANLIWIKIPIIIFTFSLGLYKRLDEFQRDIFAVLERARTLSRTDSQVFEDSAELQTHFIR